MFDDYFFELLKENVFLLKADVRHKSYILGSMLPILWNNEFISLTIEGNELSMFLSTKYKELIKETEKNGFQFTKVYNEELDQIQEYSVLKVFQSTHQISESGIVNHFSSMFKNLDIPILYINSFSNNYILIPRELLFKLKGIIDI
jgi:hypothetical protein